MDNRNLDGVRMGANEMGVNLRGLQNPTKEGEILIYWNAVAFDRGIWVNETIWVTWCVPPAC